MGSIDSTQELKQIPSDSTASNEVAYMRVRYAVDAICHQVIGWDLSKDDMILNLGRDMTIQTWMYVKPTAWWCSLPWIQILTVYVNEQNTLMLL